METDATAPVENLQESEGSEETFDSVKQRLEEIAQSVGDESLTLDQALDLYEEAIALGLQASDLLEVGIDAPEEEADIQESERAEGEGPMAEGVPAATPGEEA